MNALVRFWGRYMRARKAYERKMQEAREAGAPSGAGLWLAYTETKQDCFNELVLTIPEVRYYAAISGEAGSGFWRDVQRLAPQACVDGILRYRREVAAAKEKAREESLKSQSVKKGSK